MWEEGLFNSYEKMFILYLAENKISSLGGCWKAEHQEDGFKNWADSKGLSQIFLGDYKEHLDKLKASSLVYEND